MLSIIVTALYYLIWIIAVLIVVTSLLTWIPGASESGVGRFLNSLTEPIVAPIRKLFMRFGFARSSPVDFSPMVALLLLFLLQSLLMML